MTSKIVVNNIEADAGVSTVTFGSEISASTFTGNVTGNVTGDVVIGAGTTSAPSLSPSGDSNTGIFFPSADTVCIGEGGVEVIRVDNNSRVSIGTISQSVSKLFVSGGSISCNGSDQDWNSGGVRAFIDRDNVAIRMGGATGGGTALPLRIINNNIIAQEINTSGLVRHPYQPYVMLGISANQSVANVTSHLINWDSVPYNVGSNFNVSTDTFTAPVDGYYYVSLDVQFTAQVNQLHSGIWVNDTAPGSYFDVWCNHGDDTRGHNRTAIVYCASGDTIKLYAYQNTGSSQNLETNRTKATIRLIS